MKRVYIIGYYGHNNGGDDAMFYGIWSELRRRNVPYTFYWNGDSLPTILKDVFRADIIAVGGGTHLRNWGKHWLWQGIRTIALGILCLTLNKEFHMWNVGIDGKSWEWIARKVANFISIRDRDTFDSAVLMKWTPVPRPDTKILGINLTPVNTIYYNDPEADAGIVSEIHIFVYKWLKDHPDWRVQFISLNNNTKYSDDWINQKASILCKAEFVPYNNNIYLLIDAITKCSAFVGMRYHANVFAYMTGVPILKDKRIYSYPSTENFRSEIPLEQAKDLAIKGIKTE